MPEKLEHTNTPERQRNPLDKIVRNMKKLAEAVYDDSELVLAYKTVAFVPEVGGLGKMQIVHDIGVRVTQQRQEGAPQGVEIDCNFTYDPETGNFALYDSEKPLQISVPYGDGREKAHYDFRPLPDGGYAMETYSDVPLPTDDLTAYSALPQAILAATFPEKVEAGDVQ